MRNSWFQIGVSVFFLTAVSRVIFCRAAARAISISGHGTRARCGCAARQAKRGERRAHLELLVGLALDDDPHERVARVRARAEQRPGVHNGQVLRLDDADVELVRLLVRMVGLLELERRYVRLRLVARRLGVEEAHAHVHVAARVALHLRAVVLAEREPLVEAVRAGGDDLLELELERAHRDVRRERVLVEERDAQRRQRVRVRHVVVLAEDEALAFARRVAPLRRDRAAHHLGLGALALDFLERVAQEADLGVRVARRGALDPEHVARLQNGHAEQPPAAHDDAIAVALTLGRAIAKTTSSCDARASLVVADGLRVSQPRSARSTRSRAIKRVGPDLPTPGQSRLWQERIQTRAVHP